MIYRPSREKLKSGLLKAMSLFPVFLLEAFVTFSDIGQTFLFALYVTICMFFVYGLYKFYKRWLFVVLSEKKLVIKKMFNKEEVIDLSTVLQLRLSLLGGAEVSIRSSIKQVYFDHNWLENRDDLFDKLKDKVKIAYAPDYQEYLNRRANN